MKTIKGRIAAYTGGILFLTLSILIGYHTRDMYLHLLRDNKAKMLQETRTTAAEIEADNLVAVGCAKAMALAQESGMFGRRSDTLKYLYAVLSNNPQFYDAYTIYEPDADHEDDRSKGQPGSDATGRFNAVVNNVDGKFELTNGVDMETSLYYRGVKEKLLSGSQEKYMVTEPYVYEGVMMVEQTYPIVIDGKFAGIAGVDRTLDSLSKSLAGLKPYESADFILISRLGGIICATMDQKLNTSKIEDTPYKEILDQLYNDKTGTTIRESEDPGTGSVFYYARAPIKTGDWTLVMKVSKSEILMPIRQTLHRAIFISIVGILITLGILYWIGNSIATPIEASVDAARKIAAGDFTSVLTATGDDETDRLLTAINSMRQNLNGLIGQVKKSCVQVTTSATEIAASAMQLDAGVSEQAASTTQVSATARQISTTSRELLNTMSEVTGVATGTAELADAGRDSLAAMESVMKKLVEATDSISSKLAGIDQKANDISEIVNTITKVADQTNLLSLNASIEAEKAGQMGRGFSVVATEIRRLADQTAVATLNIEQMVKEMQTAVSVGVMEMDRFHHSIVDAMDEITKVSTQLEQIIARVQALTPRFSDVHEGMESQTQAAQQISDAMVQLSEAANQTSQSVSEFHEVTAQLNESANGLREEVAHFKVTS